MSVNIVNKTTGELTKVAGNVAPILDSVADGSMNAVTSNAVYDALGLKADNPVDAVTNGESKAVTSNAVYDYLNESVTVTRNSGETVKAFFNRVYAAIDTSKLTPFTKLVTGSASVYPLSSHGGSGLYFSKGSVTFGSGNIAEQVTQIRLHETNSHLKYLNFNTGAGTGSGNSVSWDMGESTDSTTAGPSSLTIYYR